MSTTWATVRESLERESKRWVVTGAAGFIGSHLVQELLLLGQEVVGIDNFSTGKKRNIDEVVKSSGKGASGRFSFVEADINDGGAIRPFLKGAFCMLHQAALGSVPRSIEDPIRSHQANVNGFLSILHSCVAEEVPQIVYASSSSVYGDSPELPKRESVIGAPLSPYALTKLTNELYADTWRRVYGIRTIGLRYFNVFGVRQDPEGAYAAVIPRWVKSAFEGEPCTIYGDGETSRDFCFVENVIQANILAAFAPQEITGEAFNIAVGDQTSLRELHDLIWEAVIKRKEREGIDVEKVSPHFSPFRKGDVRHSLADISRAQEILGYNPSVKVEEGILSLVNSWK